MIIVYSRRARIGRSHEGVAAVELALCLPVIVLLTLGLMETCSMIFLNQSLTVAAYEGAHTAIKPAASFQDVRDACEQIMQDRRVQGAQVVVNPSDLESLDAGEFFEVQVSAPTDANSILPARFFRGRTLTSSAVMMKEI